MDFADAGDLASKISSTKRKSTLIKEDQIWHIFVSVLRGLHHCHSMRILHRDIKSANIFLKKNGDVLLGDLNVSKLLKNDLCKTQTGTP